MKKKLLLSIVGPAAISSFGQGAIQLDNYTTYEPYVTYWGSLVGLDSNFTMGLFYWNALGNSTGFTIADPIG